MPNQGTALRTPEAEGAIKMTVAFELHYQRDCKGGGSDDDGDGNGFLRHTEGPTCLECQMRMRGRREGRRRRGPRGVLTD